jgi:PadR family transcriptional regulator AphA
VYRAIDRLTDDGLLRAAGRSEGRGPDREVVEITPTGAEALAGWLSTPVDHVRDLRTAFLVKLLLLERRGDDVGPLVAAQRARLAPVAARLAAHAAEADGEDLVVATWRAVNADAAIRFLDALDRRSVTRSRHL